MTGPNESTHMKNAEQHRWYSRRHRCRQVFGISLALACGVSLNPGFVADSHADDGAGLIIANTTQPFPADAARSAPSPSAAVQTVSGPADTTAPRLDPVETAALYYYARERQIGRVEAEIARLQALHPGFVPPQDLYVAADEIVPDETSLWDMFAADDFTGIDAEIIRRKAAEPTWEPTHDFRTKLARKKQRVRMKELAKAEDWLGLVDVSASIDPESEPDVDLVWMQIDALSAVGDRDGLARALRGLLVREGEHRLPDDHLVVTLQKALRDFPVSEIEHLAMRLWPDASGARQPAAVRLALARKRIAEFNADKDAAPVPPEALSLLALEARKTQRPEDLSLLGWFELKAERPEAAGDWFAIAMEAAPDPQNAKGMYLSLARQKRADEAYAFAAANLPDLSDDPVFLMNVLSPRFAKPGDGAIGEDTVRAYSTAIMETSSAEHAEILGWYAYNSRQFDAAEAWFRQSYGWQASADRLKGLALTFLRLDKKRDYAALKRDFVGIYPDIWPEIVTASVPKARHAASVKAPASGVKASHVKHFNAKNYPACLREIDRLGSRASNPPVAVIRGWCELGLKRFADARVSFEIAMAGKGQVRSDAIYGAGLALLGARLTDEAEALISAWPLSAARDRELRAEIYYQRARSAFDHQQFDRVLRALDARAELVAEPRDLMQMRGWAYHHSGQSHRAKAVFKQLNMVIRDSSALAAIEQINHREGR
jgi:tetratricopeptide (TPR) repeat protein